MLTSIVGQMRVATPILIVSYRGQLSAAAGTTRSRALDNFFARKYTLGILVANLAEHGLDETTG
jgi:hypothetical protein